MTEAVTSFEGHDVIICLRCHEIGLCDDGQTTKAKPPPGDTSDGGPVAVDGMRLVLEKTRCHAKDPPLHRSVILWFRQAQVLSRSR
jgi:hypothetical protein